MFLLASCRAFVKHHSSCPPESEWQTRKQRIDARLKKLGWTLVPFSHALQLNTLDRVAVEELSLATAA